MVLYRSLLLAGSVLIAALACTYSAHAAETSTTPAVAADEDQQESQNDATTTKPPAVDRKKPIDPQARAFVVKSKQASSYDQQLIGQAYLARYQNLEAAAAYKEALKLDQSNQSARGGLATAFAYQGDFPGASKIIQEGIQQSKNNAVWSAYFKRLLEGINKLKSSPDRSKYLERRPGTAPPTPAPGVIDPRMYKEPDVHSPGG